MKIILNGKAEITDCLTVAELIASKLKSGLGVICDYNGQLLAQEVWQQTNLKADDKIELLSLVGGG